MTRKQLPFFIAFIVLMFGVLACTCLGSGIPIGGFQATANAALTQAAVGVATAGAQGNSLQATANAAGNQAQATANAAATSAIATSNAANSGTGGQPTATQEGGQPTAAATESGTGGGGNTTGGPSDIPIVQGQNTILLTNDQLVSYQTKVDFAAVVKFYKDAMPKNGWTLDATTSVETSSATVLVYTKANRKAQVSVATDPTSKQTVVLITIQ